MMAGILAVLVLCEFASMIVASASIIESTYWVELKLHHCYEAGKAMGFLTVLTDSLLAATLVVLLHRRRTAFPCTISIVNRLTQYAIGTSLVTVCVTSLALVCTFEWPISLAIIALVLLTPTCESLQVLFCNAA